MFQRFKSASSNGPTLFLIVCLVLTGAMSAAATAEELLSRSPERGGIGLDLQQLQSNEDFKKSFSGRPLREGLLNKLDERLSLIVTDSASTSAITFSEVMQKLADDMGVDKLTLFQRWWDTARGGQDNNPRCEDSPDNLFCNSAQQLNGFPYRCPREEGCQALLNPFDGANACGGYTAIAFVNRFDLADKERGQHCGEFRIVFARNSGFGAAKNCALPVGQRLLIIFEALVPNPEPPLSPQNPRPDNIFVNLKGCRPIVEFWLSLSDPNMSTTDRGRALRDFFLRGLPYDGIGPVIDARNYAGGPASGQIRTDQHIQRHWTLREFKTDGGSIVPVTVKSNPGNSLFREDQRSIELTDYLIRKDTLGNLRGVTSSAGKAGETSIDTFAFGLTVPGVDHLNSFESDAESLDDGDVVTAFDRCRIETECPNIVEKEITKKLAEVQSPLSAVNIIHRIRTQTCAGCHHYSNGDKDLKVNCPTDWPSKLCFAAEESGVEVRRGIWPSTLPEGDGFTHVSEQETEEGPNSEVFALANLEAITLDELRRIRPKRILHLNDSGPDGGNTRYKISDTLKFLLMPPRFENMVLYLNQFPPP